MIEAIIISIVTATAALVTWLLSSRSKSIRVDYKIEPQPPPDLSDTQKILVPKE